MVRKIIWMIISFLAFFVGFASAQPSGLTPEDLYGEYVATELTGPLCYTRVSFEEAQSMIGSHGLIASSEFSILDNDEKFPTYSIQYYEPVPEGEVLSRSMQVTHEMNPEKADLELLEVYRKEDKATVYNSVEIIDRDHLLYRDGCWVYVLERVKK